MHKSIDLSDELSSKSLQDITKFIQEWESKDKFIQVKTSGSTGVPKIIELAKKKVRASAQATGLFFGFKKEDRLLLNLSTNFIAGKLMLVRAFEFDMGIQLAPNQKNPLEGFKDINIQFAAFVPYQVMAILENPKTRLLYERIPNVIIGGGAVSPALEKEIQTLKNQSYATFGMTETITHIALRNISKGEAFYTCLPNVTICQDERGCLVIEANPITDEIVTNDFISLLSENKFVWLGRADNVVNSGGVKLLPEVLEQKIAPLFLQNRFYFSGRKSEQFGEELVLIVEGEEPENWQLIMEEMNTVLDKYEQPKKVFFVSHFNETATGKVIRDKTN